MKSNKLEQEIIKLKKRIKNLEAWNKEMYNNHKIELARLERLSNNRIEQILHLESILDENKKGN